MREPVNALTPRLIYRFSQGCCRGLWGFGIFVAMTDGQLVKLDCGAVAQVKRVSVAGAPYATVLLAVIVPPQPSSEPPTKH